MPELPEVESARSLVEKHCMKSKIIQVNVLEQGNGPRHGLFDDIVCDIKKEECNNDDTISKTNSSFEQNDFQSALLHRKIVKVCRKGKQIWFELDGTGPSLLFHFGMTGAFTIKDIQASTYKSFKVDCTEWPPKFTKFEVIFENGTQLAFCDPRRLGRIRIRYGNPRSCPPISKLARDPIIEGLTYEYMESCLSKYSSNIKSVLLDQEKIVSGIGNWVADEVLYQADIHPSTICSSISSKKAKDLVDKLIYILTTAIQVDARSEDFPSDWLFHYRWSKRNGEKKSPLKMPNGASIMFETIGGRTSAIVQPIKAKTNTTKNDMILLNDIIEEKESSVGMQDDSEVMKEVEIKINSKNSKKVKEDNTKSVKNEVSSSVTSKREYRGVMKGRKRVATSSSSPTESTNNTSECTSHKESEGAGVSESSREPRQRAAYTRPTRGGKMRREMAALKRLDSMP